MWTILVTVALVALIASPTVTVLYRDLRKQRRSARDRVNGYGWARQMSAPFDPVAYEARKRKLLAAGWTEAMPGVLVLRHRPDEEVRPSDAVLH